MIDQLHSRAPPSSPSPRPVDRGGASAGRRVEEVRPEVVPTGSTIRLAFGAVRGVMSDPIVRWLFVVYGLVFVGRQMSAQYMTVLVHDVEHTSLLVAGSVGLVLGLATDRRGGRLAGRGLDRRPARLPAVLVARSPASPSPSRCCRWASTVAWLAVPTAWRSPSRRSSGRWCRGCWRRRRRPSAARPR
jgi:hypothetical protein